MANDRQEPMQDLDRIREILFGEHRKALEARIAELEGFLKKLEARVADLTDNVATESATLRREHAKRAELSTLFAEAARKMNPAANDGNTKSAPPAGVAQGEGRART